MKNDVNRTEIASICREEGLGNVERMSDRIYDVVMGMDDEDIPCPLEEHRSTMERHIQRNFRRLRTQLPGCNGRCTTYGCPELIVIRCWQAMKSDII